ncbi:MAG: PilZ domain-containing protein [Nitrospiraceae bacterium]
MKMKLHFNRYSRRVPVQCPAMFKGDRIVGEGHMLDLSSPGCLLESLEPVKLGEYMRLRLLLPDSRVSLQVELAAVRWVQGLRFGMEFIRMDQEDQIRLDQFLNCRPTGSARGQIWSAGVVILGAAGA